MRYSKVPYCIVRYHKVPCSGTITYIASSISGEQGGTSTRVSSDVPRLSVGIHGRGTGRATETGAGDPNSKQDRDELRQAGPSIFPGRHTPSMSSVDRGWFVG